MPSKSERPKIPAFASEAEEAQWWDDHKDMVEGELRKAFDDGTIHWRPPMKIQRKETIEVKLSPEMADKIHNLAAASGMKEEAFVGQLLKEALDNR